MWKIFKKFFKPKQDETIHNIIYSNSENWGHPFDKLPKTESKGSITEYLKKNPNKEKLFLYHLEKNFEELSAKKQSFNLKSIFVLAGACFVLIALILNLYFITQKQSNRNFQNDFTSKTIHFESLKVGQDISTENVPMHLFYNQNLKFLLGKTTKITIREIPPKHLAIFIHFGNIQIQSQTKHEFRIDWLTKKFRYTPLGTIASLTVTESSEILEVQEGSFLRKDILTGQEKEISQGTKEVFVYANDSKNLSLSPSTRYKVPATIHLKNGQTHAGYYYETEKIIFLETPDGILKFQRSEIESIE